MQMNHRELIEKLKYTKHFLIDYNKIAYESHELSVSELDTELLPANYKEVLTDSSVRVYYYAYEELIVYVITNIKNDIPLLTGLLIENKLQAYIIE